MAFATRNRPPPNPILAAIVPHLESITADKKQAAIAGYYTLLEQLDKALSILGESPGFESYPKTINLENVNPYSFLAPACTDRLDLAVQKDHANNVAATLDVFRIIRDKNRKNNKTDGGALEELYRAYNPRQFMVCDSSDILNMQEEGNLSSRAVEAKGAFGDPSRPSFLRDIQTPEKKDEFIINFKEAIHIVHRLQEELAEQFKEGIYPSPIELYTTLTHLGVEGAKEKLTSIRKKSFSSKK